MAKTRTPFIIGTRGSSLALWQARYVASRLRGEADIRVISTSGDRFLHLLPGGQLDKGLFTKELEEQLLQGQIDLAVHSLKDLPTQLYAGLALGAISSRERVSDTLLVHPDWYDASAPFPVRAGGRVGASSLRRKSLLRTFAPHLQSAELRGNVTTRIARCGQADYAAIVVASAGLARLQARLDGLLVFDLPPEVWLPAPGQAALGIEVRQGDDAVLAALSDIEDPQARSCVDIERALLHRFQGGCSEAFGAWAQPVGSDMLVRLGHEDASGRWRAVTVAGPPGPALTDRAFQELRAEMDRAPSSQQPALSCLRRGAAEGPDNRQAR